MTKGLPPIIKILINKAQEKNGKMKWKLHTANMNWNYWRFQLHCNNLEWVKPRIKIVRKKPYSTSSKISILKKMIERIIGLAIH